MGGPAYRPGIRLLYSAGATVEQRGVRMSWEPLSAAKFEPSMITNIEMTEIDGMEQGAVLRFTDVGKFGKPSEIKEVQTCYGDLYVIVNALRDYANLLEGVIDEWMTWLMCNGELYQAYS